jgi:hypothetical protein
MSRQVWPPRGGSGSSDGSGSGSGDTEGLIEDDGIPVGLFRDTLKSLDHYPDHDGWTADDAGAHAQPFPVSHPAYDIVLDGRPIRRATSLRPTPVGIDTYEQPYAHNPTGTSDGWIDDQIPAWSFMPRQDTTTFGHGAIAHPEGRRGKVFGIRVVGAGTLTVNQTATVDPNNRGYYTTYMALLSIDGTPTIVADDASTYGNPAQVSTPVEPGEYVVFIGERDYDGMALLTGDGPYVSRGYITILGDADIDSDVTYEGIAGSSPLMRDSNVQRVDSIQDVKVTPGADLAEAMVSVFARVTADKHIEARVGVNGDGDVTFELWEFNALSDPVMLDSGTLENVADDVAVLASGVPFWTRFILAGNVAVIELYTHDPAESIGRAALVWDCRFTPFWTAGLTGGFGVGAFYATDTGNRDVTLANHRAWDDMSPQRGQSAYEAWLALPGNAGKSMADFIADITGPQGPPGAPGGGALGRMYFYRVGTAPFYKTQLMAYDFAGGGVEDELSVVCDAPATVGSVFPAIHPAGRVFASCAGKKQVQHTGEGGDIYYETVTAVSIYDTTTIDDAVPDATGEQTPAEQCCIGHNVSQANNYGSFRYPHMASFSPEGDVLLVSNYEMVTPGVFTSIYTFVTRDAGEGAALHEEEIVLPVEDISPPYLAPGPSGWRRDGDAVLACEPHEERVVVLHGGKTGGGWARSVLFDLAGRVDDEHWTGLPIHVAGSEDGTTYIVGWGFCPTDNNLVGLVLRNIGTASDQCAFYVASMAAAEEGWGALDESLRWTEVWTSKIGEDNSLNPAVDPDNALGAVHWSWSPDGRHLATQLDPVGDITPYVVDIYDRKTAAVPFAADYPLDQRTQGTLTWHPSADTIYAGPFDPVWWPEPEDNDGKLLLA